MRSKSRRPAREAALRVLYEMEIGKTSLEAAIIEMRESAEWDEDLLAYAETLVRGATAHAAEIRAKVDDKLIDWDFARLAVVDRTLLRIGTFELMHVPEVPPVVTLNEAIELAKKYSTAESGKFINGILAAVWEASPKAGSASTAHAEENPAPVEQASSVETLLENSDEWEEIAKTGALRPAPKEGEL